MSSWVFSDFSLQGRKEVIHNFIKLGLQNSNLDTSNNIETDFQKLLKEGTTKTTVGDGIGPTENKLKNEIFLSMRTFFPSPDTFLKFDTTNYPENFKEEAQKQETDYGVVGWYHYNILTLGTKWNAELTNCSLYPFDEDEYQYHLDFHIQTPWSFPYAWCKSIKEKFPEINIKFSTIHECNSFYCFGNFDNSEVYDISDLYKMVLNKETEQENPLTEEAWSLIDNFDDDFTDFCEIHGDKVLQICIRNKEKLLSEIKENNLINFS